MTFTVKLCNNHSGALHFEFPQHKHVAATPYKDGTYLVNLTGPGASSVSNDEVTQQLKKKKHMNFPFLICQSDSTLTRLLIADPANIPPNIHNTQTVFTSKNKLTVKIQVCDTKKKNL